LTWLGLPWLVVSGVSVAFGLLAWKGFARFVAEKANSMQRFMERRTDRTRWLILALFASEAVGIATSYSLTQVMSIGFSQTGSDVNDVSGAVNGMLTSVLSYSHWNVATKVVVTIVVAASVGLNLSIFTSNRDLLRPLLDSVPFGIFVWAFGFGVLSLLVLGLVAMHSASDDEQSLATGSFLVSGLLIAFGVAFGTTAITADALVKGPVVH
jgi:hypothetical protein